MELNGTIFIQIIIFVITLLWLSKSLFEPIIRLFEERDRRIKGAQLESEELLALANDKALQFDREYNKAKDKARELLSQIKQVSDQEHADRLAICKAKVREKLDFAERDLIEQSKNARQHLDSSAKTIAQDIIRRLTESHAQ